MGFTDTFFQDLDSSFIKYVNDKTNSTVSQPYVYRTNNYVVDRFFQLPIPATAGSIIKYKFSTENGDIAFSSIFQSMDTFSLSENEKKKEVIIELKRVSSDIEPITGSFKAPVDGTFTLIFDNNFSWFNHKLLSYLVELHLVRNQIYFTFLLLISFVQPAFSVVDRNRCLRSSNLLQVIVKDTRQAELTLAKSQEKLYHLNIEIPALQAQLEKLQIELSEKKLALSQVISESVDCKERIKNNNEKKNGLCIRCLNKDLMLLLLSFLGSKSQSKLVCKYWFLLHKELESAQYLYNIEAILM